MKFNIEKQLAEMYIAPPADERELEVTVRLAKTTQGHIPKEASLLWLIKSQIRFINIKVWIFQILLICLYGFFVCVTLKNVEGFLLLVPVTPVVVFIGTGELSRSYRYAMAEIELPTRFSLRQVLLSRLIITVVADVFTLTCLIGITAISANVALGSLILYALVPCLVTAWGCLWIIGKVNHSQYYTATYSMGISVLGGISITLWPAWYQTSARGVWIIAFALALVAVCYQAGAMLKGCSKKLEYMD